ncbi:MAG: OmpA family protein [Hydrogenophaga sp.]|uniref:OmpA family protein n=1 Tax=Hydrogenophaga sp. TaxID=1904254 RepID=UPI003D9B96F3
MNRPLITVLALSALLAACAPVTRVTLLPQADGSASGVVVSTREGQQVLNQPFQVAEVARSGRIGTATTSADAVRQSHPQLLAQRLPAPEKFVLEFEPGTSQLTAESQGRLADIVARAQARSGGEIVVTGHTDRQGSLEANDKLSLERAHAIRNLLIERGFKRELIEAVGRGEREPVVPTDDEVAEPRNRRAELLVR